MLIDQNVVIPVHERMRYVMYFEVLSSLKPPSPLFYPPPLSIVRNVNHDTYSPFFWSVLRIVLRTVKKRRDESIDRMSHYGEVIALSTVVLHHRSYKLRVPHDHGISPVDRMETRLFVARPEQAEP